MTVHDEIDIYLAADLHNELSVEERNALHTHLVECATCRKLHQETKIMNKILEENLATEKADPTFEQRMLAGFRSRVPRRASGLMALIVDLMHARAAQIAAVAAVLIALVQIGRMVTHENMVPTYSRSAAYRELRGDLEKDEKQLAFSAPSMQRQNASADGGSKIGADSLLKLGKSKTDTAAFADSLDQSKHAAMAPAKAPTTRAPLAPLAENEREFAAAATVPEETVPAQSTAAKMFRFSNSTIRGLAFRSS